MESLPYGYSLNRYPISDFPGSAKAPKIKDAPASVIELFSRYFEGIGEMENSENVMFPCPLHADETPSCSVNIEKAVFKCHASCCNAQGSAIDLFRRMEGIDFATAKKALKHLEIGQDSYVTLAEDYLRGRLSPLFVESGQLVCRVIEEGDGVGGIAHLPMSSQCRLEAALAPVLGAAPCTLLQNLIGDEIPITVVEKILKEANLNMAGGLPDVEDLQRLGTGIHIRNWGPRNDGHTLLVDGKDLYAWDDSRGVVEDVETPSDGIFEDLEDLLMPMVTKQHVKTFKDGSRWRHVPDYPFDGAFIPVGSARETWFPWEERSPAHLKTPAQLLKRLVDMLSAGWVWTDPADPVLVALYSLYLPIFTAWDTPPIQMHITGPSQSGKSALSAGWFGGKLAGSVQMTPGVKYYHDASAAGIRQELNYKRHGIVLDELLDTNSTRMMDVVELMRGMETNQGSKTLRGTRDGKSRAYDISAPVVWSSISAGGLTQDVNRRIAIEFRRVTDPAPMEPWRAMGQTWSIEEMKQTARAVSEMLLSHLADLKTRTAAVQSYIKNSPSGGFRTLNRILPLIAIADLCGQDIQKLFRGITAKVEDLENMLSGTEPREEMRYALLFTKFPLGDGPGAGYATLAGSIERGVTVECPEFGLFYDPEDGWVGINPTAFLKATRMQGHSGITLGRLFKDMPGYRKQERRTVDGAKVRVSCFDAEALVGADAKVVE